MRSVHTVTHPQRFRVCCSFLRVCVNMWSCVSTGPIYIAEENPSTRRKAMQPCEEHAHELHTECTRNRTREGGGVNIGGTCSCLTGRGGCICRKCARCLSPDVAEVKAEVCPALHYRLKKTLDVLDDQNYLDMPLFCRCLEVVPVWGSDSVQYCTGVRPIIARMYTFSYTPSF